MNKHILTSCSFVLSTAILCAYFTSEPVAASQKEMLQVEKGLFQELIADNAELKARSDGLTRASYKLLRRLEAVEKKLEIEIPEEFKIPVKE